MQNNDEQEALIESFRNSLFSMQRDFLVGTLYDLLIECDQHGIAVSLFIQALVDAIGRDRKGREWHPCLKKLEVASYRAIEAEKFKQLSPTDLSN